jgi:hypothetical protein
VCILFLPVLVLGACADDRIPLAYGLEAGRRLEYRLTLDAEVQRTLAGQARLQRIQASFLAGQEIEESLPGGGAEVRMTLTPESLVVDGQGQGTGPPQEFLVELAPDGRVVAIEESGAAGSEALAPVGIERLLPRLRPVLPGTEVAAGDSWSSSTQVADPDGTFSFSSRSRLAALGETAGYRAALVRTTYSSPVDRREDFANAVADLEGEDIGAQEAWFALDGFLISAVSDSVGRYDVTFRPPTDEQGAAPVEGALVVRLHTEMALR